MTRPKQDLWWIICAELDLIGDNWPPELAQLFMVIADHAERVTDHIQDDTTMVEDVANWLRYEAQLAMDAELSIHTQHLNHGKNKRKTKQEKE